MHTRRMLLFENKLNLLQNWNQFQSISFSILNFEFWILSNIYLATTVADFQAYALDFVIRLLNFDDV